MSRLTGFAGCLRTCFSLSYSVLSGETVTTSAHCSRTCCYTQAAYALMLVTQLAVVRSHAAGVSMPRIPVPCTYKIIVLHTYIFEPVYSTLLTAGYCFARWLLLYNSSYLHVTTSADMHGCRAICSAERSVACSHTCTAYLLNGWLQARKQPCLQ